MDVVKSSLIVSGLVIALEWAPSCTGAPSGPSLADVQGKAPGSGLQAPGSTYVVLGTVEDESGAIARQLARRTPTVRRWTFRAWPVWRATHGESTDRRPVLVFSAGWRVVLS